MLKISKWLLITVLLLAKSTSVLAFDSAHVCRAAKSACANDAISGTVIAAINLKTVSGGGFATVYATCIKAEVGNLTEKTGRTFPINGENLYGYAVIDRYSSPRGLGCSGSTCHNNKDDWKDCKF